ncbi:hypothetical protein YC2023_106338 [Brassica napus]
MREALKISKGEWFEDTNDFNNTAVTQIVYRSLSNSTAVLNHELATKQSFASKTCKLSLLWKQSLK